MKLVDIGKKWNIAEITTSFHNQDRVDNWDDGPYPFELDERWNDIHQMIIDAVMDLVVDDYHLEKYGEEDCKRLAGALIDITMTNLIESAFDYDDLTDDFVTKLAEMNVALLTCKEYPKLHIVR